MPDPFSTNLEEGEQADPSSDCVNPQDRMSGVSGTNKLLATGECGASPSPDVKLDSQLPDSQFETSVVSEQDERSTTLTINLKHQKDLNPPKEQPEGKASDVCQHEINTTTTKASFNTLPAELRVKIYKMSWQPRRVTLARSWLAGPDDLLDYAFHSRTEGRNIYDFFEDGEVTTVSKSTAQLPVSLWVNQESRYETLRYHEIAFACPKNGSSHVYFNFQIDELEIRRHGNLQGIITGEDLARVKALVVPVGYKEARSADITLDKLRAMRGIDDLDGKTLQLHNLGLGLTEGLEPYDPESPSENAELRLLAERLQQDIAEGLGVASKLSSICPSLKRLVLEPTATCGFWPTENFASPYEEDAWFLRGNSECFTCTLRWMTRHLSLLVAGDADEEAWSVGDDCPLELGKEREMRAGQVTVAWRARADATVHEPEDERRTRRTIADWAVAATAVANKLEGSPDAEPLYEV